MRIHPVYGVLLALLGGVVLLTGCASSEETNATSAAPTDTKSSANALPPVKKGNTPDIDAVPAPAGVKTGLEGGAARK